MRPSADLYKIISKMQSDIQLLKERIPPGNKSLNSAVSSDAKSQAKKINIVGEKYYLDSDGDACLKDTSTEKFGCNGETPQVKCVIGIAATDLAEVIARCNALGTMAINNGMAKES
jgi:hypothetical protein